MEHKLLYIFVVFSLLAIVIVAVAVYQTSVIPVIVINKTITPTSYFFKNNPCRLGQCYYQEKYCYDHGSIITNSVFLGKNCVRREKLRCINGDWMYDETPQKVCY